MNSLFCEKQLIEENDKFEIFFFSIQSGNFSYEFCDKCCYQITSLNGQLRVMYKSKKNDDFLLCRNIINIDCGEIFKLQNISCSLIKLLIVKFK